MPLKPPTLAGMRRQLAAHERSFARGLRDPRLDAFAQQAADPSIPSHRLPPPRCEGCHAFEDGLAQLEKDIREKESECLPPMP